ncbi:DUF3052 family protein [Sphingomonas sp. MMS24-J45]|uniref:DUF3052 family protein n=1 Tax=Sphingomonas sp. MMS24-J45 TaxID=3238806 RepID=UPI003850196F
MAVTSGYSGTPLAKKLGLKPGMATWFRDVPESVRAEINPEAVGIVEHDDAIPGLDAAHLFVTRREDLSRGLALLRDTIAPNGMVWVSWPKKASKVATDITEDTIREIALPIGFVDVKVCAVDAVWSGLKLMIRKELRSK